MLNINGNHFKLEKNYRDAFDLCVVEEKMTDYFDSYDYIVGDWAYGKLRLKGFNEKTNKNFNEINDAQKIEQYLEEYCAFGCKYFILKRINIDNG